MPSPSPSLILRRSVGYAEPPRPHLVQKRLQRLHCGPHLLIRDVKRLRQTQPIPAQPPQVEDFAPVGCKVHIDLSAVVANEAAPRAHQLMDTAGWCGRHPHRRTGRGLSARSDPSGSERGPRPGGRRCGRPARHHPPSLRRCGVRARVQRRVGQRTCVDPDAARGSLIRRRARHLTDRAGQSSHSMISCPASLTYAGYT